MATNYLYCAGDIGFNNISNPTVAYCYSNTAHTSLASFCASTSCGLPNPGSTSVNLIVPEGTFVPVRFETDHLSELISTFTLVLVGLVLLGGAAYAFRVILKVFNL